MRGNQRRSCLALGSVINHIESKDEAHELLGHLHTWLEKDLHKGMTMSIFILAVKQSMAFICYKIKYN